VSVYYPELIDLATEYAASLPMPEMHRDRGDQRRPQDGPFLRRWVAN
jgi:hypothetical protein